MSSSPGRENLENLVCGEGSDPAILQPRVLSDSDRERVVSLFLPKQSQVDISPRAKNYLMWQHSRYHHAPEEEASLQYSLALHPLTQCKVDSFRLGGEPS